MTKSKKLKTVLVTLFEKKGINVTVFDVDKQSGYTDFMVFVTGTSVQHNSTMSDSLLQALKSAGFGKPLIEGAGNAKWILVDAGSVVINIMLEELRGYYDLESIWSHCNKVDIKSYVS